MRHIALAVVMGATSLVGCREEPTGVEVTPAAQELSQEVVAANGRVFIGFKEAGSSRGVDAQGRVLVTAETQALARKFLIDQGIVFEYIFEDIPAIAGHMIATPELVARLLAHPNIDYLEPIFPGTWLNGRGS